MEGQQQDSAIWTGQDQADGSRVLRHLPGLGPGPGLQPHLGVLHLVLQAEGQGRQTGSQAGQLHYYY